MANLLITYLVQRSFYLSICVGAIITLTRYLLISIMPQFVGKIQEFIQLTLSCDASKKMKGTESLTTVSLA